MKQIAQTDQIKGHLQASYGPDANLADLAVFELIALTTLPIRKAGGLFKNARPSLSLMSEVAASVNAESVPLQGLHNNETLPYGRFFYASVVDDAVRGLIAVDNAVYPEIVTSLDNGTIDQVSVGMANKRLSCSACGFDYLNPSNAMALYTLTCDEGHVIGTDGVHINIDGLEQLFELSIVGKGASPGARLLGPSDARLQQSEQYRLAASANPGLLALHLTPTTKDVSHMTPEQMAAFSAAVEGKATASASLSIVTGERDAVTVSLTAANVALAAMTAERDTAVTAAAASIANLAAHDTAVVALTAQAKKVVTAIGKPDTVIPTDVTAILALIDQYSAAFAAIIPVGGAAAEAAAAAALALKANPRSSAAFRAAPVR